MVSCYAIFAANWRPTDVPSPPDQARSTGWPAVTTASGSLVKAICGGCARVAATREAPTRRAREKYMAESTEGGIEGLLRGLYGG